jgi:hypothetical protein
MNEAAIAAAVGYDKPEPLVVIPVSYSACKPHRCPHQQLTPELSGIWAAPSNATRFKALLGAAHMSA